MASTKIKPPSELKAALIPQLVEMLQRRYRDPISAMEYLLNFFTAADLVEIRQELRNWEKRDGV